MKDIRGVGVLVVFEREIGESAERQVKKEDSVSVPELMNWLQQRLDASRPKSSCLQSGTVSPHAAREHVTVVEIHDIPHSLQSPGHVESPPSVSQVPHQIPTDFPAVALIFLQRSPNIQCLPFLFRMDNQVAVHCIRWQGFSHSLLKLSITEDLFDLAAARQIHLSASYIPGRDNVWADALSRQRMSSVEWELRDEAYLDLVDLFSCPQIDMFASRTNHRLPQFLSRSERTKERGPDALLENWNNWSYIYLFPPPSSRMLLTVCFKLRTFKGKILLVAPLWKAHPWWYTAPKVVSISSAPQSPGPIGERSEILRSILRFSRLQFILTSNLSFTVINDLSQAYRNPSVRQYQSCWKTFQSFLQEERIQVIYQDIVLRFLCHLFHVENRTLATIRTHKAALKAPLFCGCNLTLDTRWLDWLHRSFFLQRPPCRQPRQFWSLGKSTGFLGTSAVPNIAPSKDQLFRKALFLTALYSDMRASQLHALSRHAIWTIFATNDA
ncbi:hypothetical protein Pmani_024208 [Petrolisthes manimaculis]|uniref:Uncharacterized protein n=1 Tax=Petrolisthes manimaculis TaxID=1843537 RepID=A0AAE1PAN5_9EUCA|nr:hypothetical protein Pmani_024208 [Petrolisthes manimaculis]